MFLYIEWNSPIFYNIDRGITIVLVFSLTWILLQMSVISNPTAAKGESWLNNCSSSIFNYHILHTIKFVTILLNIQNKMNDTGSFFFFKIQILQSNMHSQNMYIFNKKIKLLKVIFLHQQNITVIFLRAIYWLSFQTRIHWPYWLSS
jgi:hypothetical protein